MKHLSFIASFLLGLAITLIATRSETEIETRSEDERTTKVREPDAPGRQVRKTDRNFLENADKAMESRHRAALRDSLMHEWAETDPAGFLAAWKSRAWPGNLWIGAGEVALARYAAIDPAGLLGYARAEGCHAAWFAYLDGVSPLAALRLLGEVDASEFPPGWLGRLMEEGMAIDPEFHRNLEQITDPASRKEALAAVASSMLSTSRFEDLSSLITVFEPEPELLDDLARKAGERIIGGDLSVAELSILPDDLREKSVLAFLNRETSDFGGAEFDPGQAADFVAELITTGWVNDHEEDILKFVSNYGILYEVYESEEEQSAKNQEIGTKWLTLADEIPSELAAIRLPVIVRALEFHHPAPAKLEEQISDPDLRDRAMAILATKRPEALDLIRSPEIFHQTSDYLEWKSQLPENSDDPFAPEPEYPGTLPWPKSRR